MKVLYHDNHLLCVAKPAGVPTVPDASGDESALDWGKRWVAATYNKPGAVFLGVVHRLDRPVSGVLLLARTSKAAARLSDAFRESRAQKHYWAVVDGTISGAKGEIVQWLLKDGSRNKVSVVPVGREGAKEARTSWHVLDRRTQRVLVELTPHTGRSHQLRVAMASQFAPLVGDLKYGASEALSDRSIALHAHQLAVDHPTRPVRLTFRAAAPELSVWDFEQARAPRDEVIEEPRTQG